MNKVQLKGRLGKDPEERFLPNGISVVTVSMATSNDYKKKGDTEWTKKPPSWHNLIAYGPVAEELLNYGKGNKIEVEGKIIYNQWTDKDGNKKNMTQIQVWRINAEDGSGSHQTQADEPSYGSSLSDNDVPF